MIPSFMEMSILIVGEIFPMFPYSKASREGIGLLSHFICPDGIKSLVLISHMEAWQGGSKASCERKNTLWWSAFHGKLRVVSFSRISSSQWKMKEYRGSGEVTLVKVTM
jgi:hypothetical protein